ncbi:MAG: hypothetical protein PHH59_12100, partial [Methylovulum sp.]|nr:hypothetical protein [Methylovulum sp.]
DRLNRAEEVAMFGNWELSLTDSTMRASDGARRLYGIEDVVFEFVGINIPNQRQQSSLMIDQ